jgi:MFS family permease
MNTQYDARAAWRNAILLLMFMMANFFDKIVVGLLAVPIMNDLKITPAQFGVLGSSFFWLFAAGGIAGGFVANRIATRWVLLALALAWSISQIPLIVPATFATFVAARVMLGFTEGPAYPVAIHSAYKWFPPAKRILPVSMFTAGASLGLLIAGVTVPLITAHWGWRANFVLLCALTIVWSALWLMFGKEGRLGETSATVAARPKVPYRQLLTDPTILASFVMQFASYWGISLGFTWMPAYYQKGLGLDAVTTGRLYALTIAVGIPISLAASFVVQRLLARGTSSRIAHGWFTAATQLVAGASFICFATLDLPLATRILLIIVAGSFGPISYAMCPAILGEVTPPKQRGAMLAIANSVASLAGILAPMLTGQFIQANVGARGYEISFGLCGALLIAGGVIGAACVHPERSAHRHGGTNRAAVPAADAGNA